MTLTGGPTPKPVPPVLCELRDEFTKLTSIVGTDINDAAMLDRLCVAIENLSRDDLEALLLFGVLATRQASILLTAKAPGRPLHLATSAPDPAADVTSTTDGGDRG